jgi:cytoskeletal protein RodZ
MDIVLSVALGMITVAGGYLGVRLSTHPIPDDSALRRSSPKRYEVTLVALSVGAIAIIVWQAVRPRDSQQTAEKAQAELAANVTELRRSSTEIERISREGTPSSVEYPTVRTTTDAGQGIR